MQKYLLGICLFLSISSLANDKLVEANQAFALRAFDAQGIDEVIKSVDLYEQALSIENNENARLEIQNLKATAHYFLGTALPTKDEKIDQHEQAMSVSDAVIAALGVDPAQAHELTQDQVVQLINSLEDTKEAILAEAIYAKGISLAQWGNLKGVTSAIGRLPEVLGLMDRVEMLGQQHIHEYGSYRTIGRIKYVLPKLFGGDLEASEDYLKKATVATLAEGQRYSVNGYNNLYFAETLYKRGKENIAKKLLEAFVAADFATLPAGSAPENREALKRAQELLTEWN